LDQLWFAEYLRTSQPKGVIASFFDSREENVNFFFRVVRRIQTLHPELLDSKPNEFQLESANKATHLVEQVVYGAEFICSMQNIPKKNDPVNAKRRICITTYEYFNQTFSHRSTISKTSPMDVPTFGNL
jgi:hypothetical protein